MSSDEQQPSAAERFADGVLALAQQYEREQAAARRAAAPPPSIRERLNEAGTIRRAWKVLEPELPALFAEAEATGRCGAESIAGIVGVTPSYVYRKLREHRAQ
jgi:hypothetical protein